MERDFDRRDVLKGMGAAGTVALAGCLGDDADINLGLLMGVTGGLEELGPPIRDAAEVVPEQINNGDTDLEVDTQFEDTETNPDEGVRGAEALVDAGYPMFVGALASDVSLPVADAVSTQDEVIQMSPASTAVDYTDIEGDWTFRTTASDAFQGGLLAEIANDRLEADSAGVLVRDDAYGRGLGQQFADTFRDEFDGTITGDQDLVTVDPDDDSFSSEIDQALTDDPDTLFIVAFTDEGVQIFRDLFEGPDPDIPILVPDGLQDASLPGNVGHDFANVTGTGPGVEDELAQGLDFFRDQVDNPDGVFVREAYDAAAVLCLAQAAADSDDAAEIRDEIRNVANPNGETVTPDTLVDGINAVADGDDVTYEGLSGPVEFDDNGDVGTASYNYFEFGDGELNILDTFVIQQ